jgi:hypothetical protein
VDSTEHADSKETQGPQQTGGQTPTRPVHFLVGDDFTINNPARIFAAKMFFFSTFSPKKPGLL